MWEDTTHTPLSHGIKIIQIWPVEVGQITDWSQHGETGAEFGANFTLVFIIPKVWFNLEYNESLQPFLGVPTQNWTWIDV